MDKQYHILIVDDNPDFRNTLQDILKVKGYAVLTAASGKAALERIQEKPPDVALIDLKLADMSGLEVLKQLKALTPSTEAIMITGYASRESVIEAVNLGAYSYVQKPYDIDQLLLTITRAAEKNMLAESLRESETRFRSLMESAPDSIVTVDGEGRIVLVNQEAVSLFGYEADELIGKPVEKLLPERYSQRHVKHRDGYIAAPSTRLMGVGLELSGRRKDGQEFPVEIALSSLETGEGLLITAIIRDITERKQLEDERLRRLMMLNALYTGAQKLVAANDLREMASDMVDSCVNLYGAALAWLGLSEPDGSVQIHTISPSDFEHLQNFTGRWDDSPEGRGPTGTAIRTGSPIVIPDIRKDPGEAAWRADLAIAAGLTGIASFPLISRQNTFGALTLYSDQPGYFNSQRIEFFQSYTHLAAAALENARLNDETRRQTVRAEALVRIASRLNAQLDLNAVSKAVCEESALALGVSFVTISLYDEQRDGYAPVADYGLSASARQLWRPVPRAAIAAYLEQDEPIFVISGDEDLAALPNAALYAALKVRTQVNAQLERKEQPVGLLSLLFEEGQQFDADDLNLVRGIVDQATLALVNARLFDQAQNRLQQLSALRNIDMAITGSIDLRVTLDVLLREVTDKLSIDAADVLLYNPHMRTLEYGRGCGFRSSALQHTNLRLGEGYAGEAALERRTIHVDNLMEGENGLITASPLFPDERFVTYYGVPLIAKGEIKGVLEIFHRERLERNSEWLNFLETLAGQAAMAIDSAKLFNDLQRANIELTMAYDSTLEGWSHALELRDMETEGHSQRVTDMTMRLARALVVSESELIHVRRGALLHDIGKMGIPDSILHKPGKLTDEEWEIMRQHPVYAYNFLSQIDYLRPALDIPYSHHEKWDGSGYPRGLKGEQIPLAARLFAVVDVWDALNSDRPYRKAWPNEKTLAYIQEESDRHFDPQVVDAFLNLLSQLDE